MQQYQLPGMAAVVIHNNEIIAQGAVGIRDKNDPKKTPLTVNDLFHLGSDTKAMTATTLAWFVQSDQLAKSWGAAIPYPLPNGSALSWDTTLVQIFPEFASSIHPNYANITLRQLVTHRSGLPPEIWDTPGAYYNNDNAYWQFQNDAKQNVIVARGNFTKYALSQPSYVAPGTWEYSNVGYIIAGHVIERMLGNAYSWETLNYYILQRPLGLTTLGYGAPGTPGVYDQPRGHEYNGPAVEPNSTNPTPDNPPMFGPAGTVHLSLADWATFVNMHLQGGRGDAQRLAWYQAFPVLANWYNSLATSLSWYPLGTPIPWYMNTNTLQTLQTPVTTSGSWGAMGWVIGGGLNASHQVTDPVLYHFGSNTLWSAVAWVDITNDFAVLVVSNMGSESTALNKAVGTILCNMGGEATSACTMVHYYPGMY